MRMSRVAARAASAWPAAAGVVAVGQQHDALLGVVREERRGQPKRGADVARRADRRGGEAVDLVELGRQPLDEGLLAEGHDAGDVAVGDDVQRLAQERQRILATGVADRVGQVDDEDGGQPIDRQDEAEPGQREDEGARAGRSAPPARSGAGPRPTRRRALRYRANVIARAGMSRSSASGVSKARPISRSASRARSGRRSERRIRMSPSRW